MSIVIVPPTKQGPDQTSNKVFLAGGITSCPDWQTDVINILESYESGNVTLYNPRRKDWDMLVDKAEDQIAWEHEHLMLADWVLFWFPCETLCPIVLFELGKMLMTNKKLLIGCHPDYQRRTDVALQTRLIRPTQTYIYHNLLDMTVDLAKVCLGLSQKPLVFPTGGVPENFQ